MGTPHQRPGEFRKVGQNHFRYAANEVHYAVFKVRGKNIYKSLEAADRELAQRRLKGEPGTRSMIEPPQARMRKGQPSGSLTIASARRPPRGRDSLTPWRGEWYWSGEQRTCGNVPELDTAIQTLGEGA